MSDIEIHDGMRYVGARPADVKGDHWRELEVLHFFLSACGIPVVAQAERPLSPAGQPEGWGLAWQWTAIDHLGDALRRRIIKTCKAETAAGFSFKTVQTPRLVDTLANRSAYDEAVQEGVLNFYATHLTRIEAPTWPNGKPNWSAALRPARCIAYQHPSGSCYFQFPDRV